MRSAKCKLCRSGTLHFTLSSFFTSHFSRHPLALVTPSSPRQANAAVGQAAMHSAATRPRASSSDRLKGTPIAHVESPAHERQPQRLLRRRGNLDAQPAVDALARLVDHAGGSGAGELGHLGRASVPTPWSPPEWAASPRLPAARRGRHNGGACSSPARGNRSGGIARPAGPPGQARSLGPRRRLGARPGRPASPGRPPRRSQLADPGGEGLGVRSSGVGSRMSSSNAEIPDAEFSF